MKKLIIALSFVAICSYIATANASVHHTHRHHAATTHKSKSHHRKMRHRHGHSNGGAMMASWYGPRFHGKKTSSGERYDMYEFTAAHRTLPLNSYAKVTNLHNNRSVVVRINDRGGFRGRRAMDLSYAAAREIGITGIAAVEITPLNFD